jgi:hypothetical protein
VTIRLSVIGEVEVIIVKLLVIDPKATQESSFLTPYHRYLPFCHRVFIIRPNGLHRDHL